MRLKRTSRIAVSALRKNMVRALLTVLGIIIGIAAVITMVEIGQGSSRAIQSTIASMGANTLLVLPGTATSGGVSWGSGSGLTLTPDDATALKLECPAVEAVAPIVRARTQVVYGNRNWVPQYIQGTTSEFLQVRDWTTLAEGEMFTDRDVRNSSKVAVIGQTLVRELFGGASPIGREIRVQNVSFKVIGVLSSKGANMMGSDQDDIVLAPWTSVKYRVSGSSSGAQSATTTTGASSTEASTTKSGDVYPSSGTALYPEMSEAQRANTPMLNRFTNVDQILVSARSSEEVAPALEQIGSVLRARHRIRDGDPDDFTVRDMSEMTNALSSTSSLMTRLLLSVALISLVVGGVGIMNIMLVSVTERTREIGLRMAVGARGRDILQQFLVEATILCLIGGAFGIFLGRAASFALRSFLKWPTEASLPAALAAFGVSAAVGILFGFYPAYKASRMDPIEALRYE